MFPIHNRAFALCLLSWMLFACPTAVADEATGFRAGAAMIDISPPLGELVVGGFVPFNEIHDPSFKVSCS